MGSHSQPPQWQPPNQPYYGPPPQPYQYGPPPEAYQYTQPPAPYTPPPKVKRGKGVKGPRKPWLIPLIVGVVALIVGIGIGTSTKSSSSSQNAAKNSVISTATVTTRVTITASAVAAPAAVVTTAPPATTAAAPSPAPKTVLALSGSGIKKSTNFVVTQDQWTIAYSYNCQGYGGSGNFQIFVYNSDGSPSDVAANELGPSGNDSTTEHGDGTYYLQMNSECSWHVTVTG